MEFNALIKSTNIGFSLERPYLGIKCNKIVP